MPRETNYVYVFGDGEADGDATMRNLLGGKGANLAEMTKIGLPVPAGFTLTTEACTYYDANDRTYPPELKPQVDSALRQIERVMGAEFGSKSNPLLLSCRSGARESMPGMMDTVLNIGLNEETVRALAKQADNEAFAWDSYRRFIQMYGGVALGMKPQDKKEEDPFEAILHHKKEASGVQYDSELTADDLKQVVAEFKRAIKDRTGVDFPTDPYEQCGAPLERSSEAGETTGPSSTAATTASPTSGALPQTFRQWCLATSGMIAPPAWG